MKIKFMSFGDAGNLEEERIGFKVLETCDLKFFAVYHTRKTENGFYNRPYHVFWFYPKNVNAGDEIVVYTKKGTDSIEERGNHQVHFLYWKLDEAILKEGDCIVLSEISDWSVHPCKIESVTK